MFLNALEELTNLAVSNLRGPDTAETRLITALLVRRILLGDENTRLDATANIFTHDFTK